MFLKREGISPLPINRTRRWHVCVCVPPFRHSTKEDNREHNGCSFHWKNLRHNSRRRNCHRGQRVEIRPAQRRERKGKPCKKVRPHIYLLSYWN